MKRTTRRFSYLLSVLLIVFTVFGSYSNSYAYKNYEQETGTLLNTSVNDLDFDKDKNTTNDDYINRIGQPVKYDNVKLWKELEKSNDKYYINIGATGDTIYDKLTTTLDVVLVLDNSNSMYTKQVDEIVDIESQELGSEKVKVKQVPVVPDAPDSNRMQELKKALYGPNQDGQAGFFKELKLEKIDPDNDKVRIALVTFASEVLDGNGIKKTRQTNSRVKEKELPNYSIDFMSGKEYLSDDSGKPKDKILNEIQKLSGDDLWFGGTFTDLALKKAYEKLSTSNADKKAIIVISDGAPTISSRIKNYSNYEFYDNTFSTPASDYSPLGTGNVFKTLFNQYGDGSPQAVNYRKLPNRPTGEYLNGSSTYEDYGFKYTTQDGILVDNMGISSKLLANKIRNQDTKIQIYSLGAVLKDEVSSNASKSETEEVLRNIANPVEKAGDKYFYSSNSAGDLANDLVEIATKLIRQDTVVNQTLVDPMADNIKLVSQKDDIVITASSEAIKNKIKENLVIENGNTIKVTNINLGKDDWFNLKYEIEPMTYNSAYPFNEFIPTNKRTTISSTNKTYDFPIPQLRVRKGKVTVVYRGLDNNLAVVEPNLYPSVSYTGIIGQGGKSKTEPVGKQLNSRVFSEFVNVTTGSSLSLATNITTSSNLQIPFTFTDKEQFIVYNFKTQTLNKSDISVYYQAVDKNGNVLVDNLYPMKHYTGDVGQNVTIENNPVGKDGYNEFVGFYSATTKPMLTVDTKLLNNNEPYPTKIKDTPQAFIYRYKKSEHAKVIVKYQAIDENGRVLVENLYPEKEITGDVGQKVTTPTKQGKDGYTEFVRVKKGKDEQTSVTVDNENNPITTTLTQEPQVIIYQYKKPKTSSNTGGGGGQVLLPHQM